MRWSLKKNNGNEVIPELALHNDQYMHPFSRDDGNHVRQAPVRVCLEIREASPKINANARLAAHIDRDTLIVG